ncbi:hypothetical protein CEQ90_11480 [Lewinellaceae bacterium SD302]|nr:hypothetical protein CEQ90_11480 [Lewinellaceae bacterium SD302]
MKLSLTRAVAMLCFSLLFTGTATLLAQNPTFIPVDREAVEDGIARMPCAGQDAGVIQNFGPFIGQSNDATPDTIFLCFGDSIFINHDNGSISLNGDPVNTTPAGIGYALFDCPPTTEGPALEDIAADPCVLNSEVIASPFGFFVDSGADLDGDGWFWNLGQIQGAFPVAGAPVPRIVHFAPITFDALDPISQLAVYERENNNPANPPGQCLDLNISATFAVAYLNEIEINDAVQTGCEGSFRVRGGLPELLPGNEYNVTIELTSDPTITGTAIVAGVGHDEVINYTVPQPGDYRITVEDGKSCEASRVVDQGSCDAVTFTFPFENHLPGEMFCVSATVAGFVDVLGFQHSLSYDPTVLEMTSITTPGNLPGFTSGSINGPLSAGGSQPNGTGRVTYTDLTGTGQTLVDGDEIYELCFTAIGDLGECSPLTFTDMPIPIEVSTLTNSNAGFIINNGTVCLSSDPFFVDVTTDSISCQGSLDGCINVIAAGGCTDYEITYRQIAPMNNPFEPVTMISGSPSEVEFCGLGAGIYATRVEDCNGDIVQDTVEVFAPPALGLSILDTLPSCFGLSDGVICIQVTLDGFVVDDPVAAGYTFNWNNTAANTACITGLDAPFTYEVTVTSPTGCTVEAALPLGDPARVLVLPMEPDDAVTDATCSGSEDGSITISASGGTTMSGDYTFSWSNNEMATGTMVTLDNLDPGFYEVTVTDDNGCEAISSFNVLADKILSVNAVVEDVQCFGDDNGSIFATGVTTFNGPGGMPDLPYTFVWSANAPVPTNTITTTEIDNLGPDSYTLTMTDDEGCTIDTTFTIEEPTLLQITEVITTNETCETGSDGTATVVVDGGVYPYTYAWSSTADLDSTATGLVAGTNFMVTVTDANGCEQIETFDISSPQGPIITAFDDTFVSCPESTDGELTVVATDGSGPISTYQWANEDGDIIATGPNTTTITNLAPGCYTVTITAVDACFTIDTACVLSPGLVALDSVQVQTPTCPGESNGRIQLFPSGGTPPYTYTWSTNPNEPGTINPLTSLAAGTYFVTVVDANDCTPLVDTIVLPDPPSITAEFTSLVPVTCPDDVTCNGAATVMANYSDGTNGTFNFVWSNGDTELGVATSMVDMLCRGEISVDITDGSCGVTFSDTIQSPEEIVIGVEIEPVSCNGLSDGMITLDPMGGTQPFDFFWVGSGNTTPIEDNLSAGIYTANVTDANGCARQQVVEVTEPDELVLSLNDLETTTAVSCAGDTDGIISVFVSSGNNNPLLTEPYTWSGGVAPPSSSTATNLSPGTYNVTVTDIKGCTDELSYTIGEPTPITFSLLPIEEPLCFGETTLVLIDTAFGGRSSEFADFSFSVNNDGFQIPVTQPGTTFAGQTVVTVFDTVGCSVSDTFSVNQPPQILVDLPESILIELGDSLTVLNPIISPAGDVYDFLWTPGDFLSSDTVRAPTIFPLESTDYTFQVTNANGCQAFADIFVEVDANRNVYIPNVFSPNRDGRNEDFRIFACLGVQSVNFVRIFDRWGGQIYEATSLEPNCLDGIQLWDGMYREKPASTGVYVYMIEVSFLDGRTLLYRGDVSILR